MERLSQSAIASFQSLLQFNSVRELANETGFSAPIAISSIFECDSVTRASIACNNNQEKKKRRISRAEGPSESLKPHNNNNNNNNNNNKKKCQQLKSVTSVQHSRTTTTTTITHAQTSTTAVVDPSTIDEHIVSWDFILKLQDISPDLIKLTKKNGGLRVPKKEQEQLRARAKEFFGTDGTLFNIIYADPPWQYRNRDGFEGQACDEYSTMSHNDICAMPVAGLAADDCYLLMWATGPKMLEAFEVMRAWGFRYVCIFFNWVKVSKKGTARVCMANYTLPASEFCLLGVRGKTQWMKDSKTIQQVMFEPITVHSRKPDESYRRIHHFFRKELPRIELFARRVLPTWHAWGNELPPEIQYPEGLRDIFPLEK